MTKINKSKIAVLTTVANFELYKITSKHFPKGIQKYVIDGRDGMYGVHSIKYMMKKLRGKGIEWLIMCDEDVIFTKSDVVFSIINEMLLNEYTVCGIRDGGLIKHRKQNPWAINTFFSVLNFKEIEEHWNEKEVLKNQYILENEFKDDLSKLTEEFDTQSIYEAYYCFYFWLRRRNKKFLFLDAQQYDDGISNTVLFQNQVFLYHTWYARSYGRSKKHTERINYLLDNKLFEKNDEEYSGPIIFEDETLNFQKKIKKGFRESIQKFFK